MNKLGVGEYEPQQWEQLKTEAESGLERIAADRAGLDAQLIELRSIQKLSEVGSTGNVSEVAVAPEKPADEGAPVPAVANSLVPAITAAPRDQGHLPLDQVMSSPGSAVPSPESSQVAATVAAAPVASSSRMECSGPNMRERMLQELSFSQAYA